MGKREENKARTRARIVEVAFALFTERGFEATRVQDIVREVGISQATFFNYFPTKESVLAVANVIAADLHNDHLEEMLGRAEVPLVERLEHVQRVAAEFFASDLTRARLLAGPGRIFDSPDPAMAERNQRSFALLAALFAQGQEAGEVDPALDPALLAQLHGAHYVLTIDTWLADDPTDDPAPLASRLIAMVHILFHGIGTRRG